MAILYRKAQEGIVTSDAIKKSTGKISGIMKSYNRVAPTNTLPNAITRTESTATGAAPTNLDSDRIKTFRDYTRDYYINKMAQQHFVGDRKKELDEYNAYMQSNKGGGTSKDELANNIEVAEKYATDPKNIKFYIPEDKFKDYLNPEELKQFQDYYYDTNNDVTEGNNIKSRAVGARAMATASGNRGIYDNVGMAPLWANNVANDNVSIGSFNKGFTTGEVDRPFTYNDTQYMPKSITNNYKIDYYREKATAFDPKTGTEELKSKFNSSWDKDGNRVQPKFKRGGILLRP